MAYKFKAASKRTTTMTSADQAAAGTWYRDQVHRLSSGRQAVMTDQKNLTNQIDYSSIGKMYCFFYDPKWKQVLPIYDTFPLVFPIGMAPGGFLGINMHYLPPVLRAKLMEALYETINSRKYDKNTALRISYQILNSASRFSDFQVCVKHYLTDHVVGGRYLNVEAENWDYALMLPLQQFVVKPASWLSARKSF